MDKLLAEPLFYIFAVYGLSFLAMAYFITEGIIDATSIKLVSSFYMLVFFGTLHGMAELTDWARFIGRILGQPENQALLYTSQILMMLSFVFLLQFAINLFTYKSEKKGIIRSIPFFLFVIFLGVVYSMGISDISQIGLYARYGFGFAGSALTAIMLFSLSKTMASLGNNKLLRGLNISAAGFVCYAVVGGLIITPVLGLPIQLFRAACAVVIALASVSMLQVFKVE